MNNRLFSHKAQLMDAYRSLCVTIGQDILIHRNSTTTPAKALDVDDDGALIALLSDGKQTIVNSGEVSIRGMYNYI